MISPLFRNSLKLPIPDALQLAFWIDDELKVERKKKEEERKMAKKKKEEEERREERRSRVKSINIYDAPHYHISTIEIKDDMYFRSFSASSIPSDCVNIGMARL